MRSQQHETLEVDYRTFMEVVMADEKRKRRGRVPFAEKKAAIEKQIANHEAKIHWLNVRLGEMKDEHQQRIAAMQKELEA